MDTIRALRLTLLPIAALFAAVPAQADTSLCPDTVVAKQAGTAPSKEWSVTYSAAPSQFEMVTFFSGQPKDEASLVYDELAHAKDVTIATWKFAKDPRGYWVKCSYRNTTLELSKALPSTVKACHVTYSREVQSPAGLPIIERNFCQERSVAE